MTLSHDKMKYQNMVLMTLNWVVCVPSTVQYPLHVHEMIILKHIKTHNETNESKETRKSLEIILNTLCSSFQRLFTFIFFYFEKHELSFSISNSLSQPLNLSRTQLLSPSLKLNRTRILIITKLNSKPFSLTN